MENVLISELTSSDPNMEHLKCCAINTYSLSPDDADIFLFELVKNLNQKMTPVQHLELFHTDDCNLRCQYCFEGALEKKKYMSKETARQSVDFLLEYSRDLDEVEIIHFGGEPLMNFGNVIYTIDYANKRASAVGKRIIHSMTTNGTLLTEKRLGALLDRKVRILLSIDGGEESHNRYRLYESGMGSFRKVKMALEILKQRGCWIGVKMTVMPENAERLYDDFLELIGMGANQFIFGMASGVHWGNADVDRYYSGVEKIHSYYRANPRNLKILGISDEPKPSPVFGCRAGKNAVSVTADGRISPCSKMVGLSKHEIVSMLGHVKYGLYCIKMRESLHFVTQLKDRCLELGIEKDYTGGCYADNYVVSGNIFQPNLFDHSAAMRDKEIWNKFNHQALGN